MTPKVGEVLHLGEDLAEDIRAGLWCVMAIRWGGITELKRVGIDEDGHLSVTYRCITVTRQQRDNFIPVGFNIFEEERE